MNNFCVVWFQFCKQNEYQISSIRNHEDKKTKYFAKHLNITLSVNNFVVATVCIDVVVTPVFTAVTTE